MEKVSSKFGGEFITSSAEETQKLGEQLAKEIKSPVIITLHGELGSGKTTFVQGLAKGLGIKRRIISPTFVIVRSYSSSERSESRSVSSRHLPKADRPLDEARTITLYHIDLYRVENVHDLEGLGIEEILNDKNSIVAIEWPEKLGDLLPEKRIEIFFEYVDEEKRKIVWKTK